MARRRRIHKVSVTASAIGLLALFALPFVSLSRSRIATGDPVDLWVALPLLWVVALCLPWVVVLVAAVGDRRTTGPALARGLGGVAAAVLPFAGAGVAATRLLETAGEFARVSIGAGVWLSAFMAYAVVLGSRRELGRSALLSWSVALAAPVALVALFATGVLSDLGIVVEFRNLGDRYWSEVVTQLTLSATAIALATTIGVSLGLLAYVWRPAARPVFAVVNLFQTIPGLALIGLLVGPFAAFANRFPIVREFGIGGLGWAPVVTALTLYALLPIVRNAYEGLRGVPPSTISAGRGMGMTSGQLMRKVELPIALPVLFSGVRTSAEQTVGNATLGAFAAAGGLGLLVFQGLAAQSVDLIVLGSVSIAALALLVDAVMRIVQRLVTPRGLRRKEDAR